MVCQLLSFCAVTTAFLALCFLILAEPSHAFAPSPVSRKVMGLAGTNLSQAPPNRSSSKLISLAKLESDIIEEEESTLLEDDKDNQESTSPLLARLASSSPLGALAILLGIVLLHEGGHYLAARSIGVHPEEFSVGFGPKIFGLQAFGGDNFNLRIIPFGGYVGFSPEILLPLPWYQRIYIASAGVVVNLLIAFSIFFWEISYGNNGLPQLRFEQGIRISGVADGKDVPARGKLEAGDVILAINDKPIQISLRSPSRAESERVITNVISTIQATPDGESIQFTVLRSGGKPSSSPIQVQVTPKRFVSDDGDTTTTTSSEPPGPPTLGAFLQPNIVGVEQLRTDSVLQAAQLASRYTWLSSKEIAIGLYAVLRSFLSVSKSSSSSDYQVRGPVGVIKRASGIVATRDRDSILNYVATISINFAVVNTAPIPPADGFQIVYVLLNTLLSTLLR